MPTAKETMDTNRKDPPMRYLGEFTCLMEKTLFHLDPGWEDYNQLIKALQYGQKEIAKLLVQKGARVNKDPPLFNFCTPLHLAVSLGCSKIVRELLAKGASINIRNNNYETPLIMAAKMGKNLIIDLLLSVDGQENYSNRENISHMHIACMRNRVDIVKKLVQQGARINHAVKLNSLHWPGYTPLHFAVQFQCIETVQFLVGSGADITAKTVNKLTPLHLADTLRNETIIDTILAAHTYEITNPVNSEGLSHFHIACTRNDPLIVESFLKHGVDINTKVLESSFNWPGYRPINFAIDYECMDVVKLLLTHDANLDSCDIVRNPIQYAYRTANKVIIDLLLSKNNIPKVNIASLRKLTDLHVACMRKNLSLIDELVQYGNLTKKNIDLNQPIWTGCTPLHLAIRQKCAKTAEVLLKHGADIARKDSRGKTPLHLAFESKQMDIVDLILSAHSSVTENPVDNEGLSHFHISCMRKKLKTVKGFLQNGVNINAPVHFNSVFWPGYTPLHFASEFELKKVVKLLLKHGANFEAKNGIGLTPLDIAIKCTDTSKLWRDEVEDVFAIIESILGQAASVGNTDAFDDRGFSLLHVSCVNNDTSAIEHFLTAHPGDIDKPVNWTASDWLGYTPLHVAVHFDSKEAAELLLEKGADISIKTAEGNTPLHEVFSLRSHLREIEIPELIFTQENLIGDEGYSHFHIACSIGNIKAVEYFLGRGVDVNQATKFTSVYEYTGQSPLHLAVSNIEVCEEVVQLLLRNGADVSARDAELNTPLHCTKYNSKIKIAKILLAQGADVNARNMYNETALLSTCFDSEFAESKIIPKKIQFLLESGADVNIENEEGEIPLMIFSSWPNEVQDKIECIVLMMKHVKKLRLIDYHVSKKNELYYFKLLADCEAQGYYKEAEFVEQCTKEVELMTSVSLDSYTTLYNILGKSTNEMALHSENTDLQKIVTALDFPKRYPTYGFLLKLQFKRGLARRPLLETAKESLSFITAFPLPDACSEKICQHLTNEDLQNINSSRERGQSNCQ